MRRRTAFVASAAAFLALTLAACGDPLPQNTDPRSGPVCMRSCHSDGYLDSGKSVTKQCVGTALVFKQAGDVSVRLPDVVLLTELNSEECT